MNLLQQNFIETELKKFKFHLEATFLNYSFKEFHFLHRNIKYFGFYKYNSNRNNISPFNYNQEKLYWNLDQYPDFTVRGKYDRNSKDTLEIVKEFQTFLQKLTSTNEVHDLFS